MSSFSVFHFWLKRFDQFSSLILRDYDSVCVMFVSRLCGPKVVWVPVRKRRAKAAPFQTPLTRPSPTGTPLWSHEQPQHSQPDISIGNSQRKSVKRPRNRPRKSSTRFTWVTLAEVNMVFDKWTCFELSVLDEHISFHSGAFVCE